MECSKWKYLFIKNNVARNIDMPGRDIKAFIPFVKTTITQEGTLFGAKLKLVLVERTQVWPNGTPKDTKEGVVGLGAK